ncbi:MAG TPA: adenylate/guanylate cyclase domain-containing protein, partial [Thermoguttaceae bacterium]|nr:adenylate/guanylate cyclase domain-containing protein [Thermoguttaceae bacterium]
MVGSLRRMRRLERQQAILSQFFSPLVLKNLGGEAPDRLLEPQETEASVLFCDLRGFSRRSEQESKNLRDLLDRVSQALGVMTRHILEEGGVVGDYQGDAALGFWGWPVVWDDMVERTCRAALAIRQQFQTAAQNPQSPLAGFQVGIGIAAGRAVAGRIGPPEQAKVTVFGPVVNLAARLESMTKIFHAPILLDSAMAEAVRRKVPPAVARVRRVAVVRPYGMDSSLEIAELLPPADQYPLLSDDQIRLYETGLDAFLAGRWQEAYQCLHQLPAEDQVAEQVHGHAATQGHSGNHLQRLVDLADRLLGPQSHEHD